MWTSNMHFLKNRNFDKKSGIPISEILLKSKNYDIIILSGGFDDLIKTFLVKHDLLDLIKEVFAIPTTVSDDGKITVNSIPKEWGGPCRSPGAGIICKASIIKYYMAKNQHYEKLIYVGDGSNDICPPPILGVNDIVFPRQDYKMESLIKNQCISAKIIPWKDGFDIMKYI